ncbi:type IV secretion protein Rhs [Pantoea trifolii]|uniref:Type IV secretion protein Rhs n=1 Tax=Pantoea trifolii TaxID=2968030 RepID=A0ABT1VL60_9GAMM|nr:MULTISPECIES: type IV secretion protein Rhs [unclassified Pantoea]MCQ8228114.1 type IV secretion protein Rhs [Pantoea sp. MMK2]MCQ8236287.1 type IV secretion protein Rhs [Pantoea sp. MMK3]
MTDKARKAAIKEGSLRLMTAGEIQLAKKVFGEKISYGKVWIHHDSYLPFGLQHERVAMTPNGEIYYRTALYRADFSDLLQSDIADMHVFIHELSHVWQRERGMCVICRGVVSFMADYTYDLDGRLLSEYPMEQQAQIIADNYILSEWGFDRWNQFRMYNYVKLIKAMSETEASAAHKVALRGFPW